MLAIITRIQSNWLNLAFMALAILGNWIDHWLYFPALVSASVILGVIRYVHDQKWLKEAVEYLRIVRNRSIWKTAAILLLFVVSFLLLHHYELTESVDLKESTTLSLLIISFVSVISDRIPIFVDSIKTFEETLQLPGRKGKHIPWKAIRSIELDDQSQLIISGEQVYSYGIDEQDIRRAQTVIQFWKERSGRLRFN